MASSTYGTYTYATVSYPSSFQDLQEMLQARVVLQNTSTLKPRHSIPKQV